ncbi:MinD/ParA family protein [Clostridium felsineum]|uniref:MinD/ParA family protein n=1 Tax=Clostridium felsineum TaxID=36839 RepID=UPI00098BE793|nr:MinD/ParA family protein [Clostridium felsineum]MCR3757840.1 MinD/ParA family protein [Clostridium felsineum]URZ16044.1 Flagellum site-determining protein YlxH [Clostridium felsineum DSM 794]
MLDQAERLRNMALSKNHENIKKKPVIITVTSGKGGVGKSNFVVNLSITLQKMNKRVLIFDADVGMGNDDILLGCIAKYSVFDVIYNDMKIEDVMVEGPLGVKLLPGGSGITRFKDLTENQINAFVEKLSSIEDFDYIIMDTGAGVNRSVLGFISCCEELIILTTPEPTSLTDAYSLFKAVVHFNIKSYAKVIINRVVDNKEGIETYKKFESVVNKFLKTNIEFLGSVSEDSRLIRAVRKQIPFVVENPNCDAARDINHIASKLIGTTTEKDRLGLDGLFKKMFKIFS